MFEVKLFLGGGGTYERHLGGYGVSFLKAALSQNCCFTMPVCAHNILNWPTDTNILDISVRWIHRSILHLVRQSQPLTLKRLHQDRRPLIPCLSDNLPLHGTQFCRCCDYGLPISLVHLLFIIVSHARATHILSSHEVALVCVLDWSVAHGECH